MARSLVHDSPKARRLLFQLHSIRFLPQMRHNIAKMAFGQCLSDFTVLRITLPDSRFLPEAFGPILAVMRTVSSAPLSIHILNSPKLRASSAI